MLKVFADLNLIACFPTHLSKFYINTRKTRKMNFEAVGGGGGGALG